jgi:DnaJ-class molecular chaperone
MKSSKKNENKENKQTKNKRKYNQTKNNNNNNHQPKKQEIYEYTINDFYAFFNLHPDSNQHDIRKRYTEFLLSFHPDKNQHLNEYPEFKEKINKMNEITMVGGKILLNERARIIYDRMLLSKLLPPHANAFFENHNILDMIRGYIGDKNNDLFS